MNRERFAQWQQFLKDAVDKYGERHSFVDSSNQEIEPLYTPQGHHYDEKLGFPGEYPFTRGIRPAMYRSKLWTMRQYAGFGTAAESNKRYRYLLTQGQTGLSVAFDLPTQIGYDSDYALCKGEVGKVGVAIDTLVDMETLFADIPLDQVSTSMTINAPASILLAFYIAVAEKRGIAKTKLAGTIQNDILKEYIARGTYIFPPEPSLRLITDVFAYCASEVPRWNTISISGYHVREAGATAAQEVAFTLANGITYVENALRAGLSIDTFAPRLSFFFNAHNDLLEEIAKFRAARRLWAQIIKKRFHSDSPRSQMLRFHVQTAGSTLTAQQPENNIVRVTIQALAAVLGGAQSLHTNSKDEALALPTEEAVRIALRTQQIIAQESGVTSTVDPLGGSYYVERLTDSIQHKAEQYLQTIDDMGGMVPAIQQGYVQKEIQTSAYRYQQEIEAKQRIIVGVNDFQLQQEAMPQLLTIPAQLEQEQCARLNEVRTQRDQELVQKALVKIKKCAQTRDNLMPVFVEAALNYVSLGEICGVLREVFGEYQEKIVL